MTRSMLESEQLLLLQPWPMLVWEVSTFSMLTACISENPVCKDVSSMSPCTRRTTGTDDAGDLGSTTNGFLNLQRSGCLTPSNSRIAGLDTWHALTKATRCQRCCHFVNIACQVLHHSPREKATTTRHPPPFST